MSDTNDADKLRAERDALEKQVEKLEARPERRRKVRTVLTAILVILAVLCFTVAVPGLWARRTIFNTEKYVETVAPLASDPAVQEYLARTITEQAFTALDVENRLREVLQQRDARLDQECPVDAIDPQRHGHPLRRNRPGWRGVGRHHVRGEARDP